jgi:hypothetical protein
MYRLTTVLLMLSLQFAAAGALGGDLPLTGRQAEDFLRTAKIVHLKNFDTKGVTVPRKAALDDGEHRLSAIFKDVDIYEPMKKLSDGEVVRQFRDNFRSEIAAYEIDKMLGLGIVPPCVQRRISGDVGALCLWVEETMTEWERRMEKKIDPPDPVAWNDQMNTIGLLQRLIDDIDYKNISNLLVDKNFKIYKVDSSRAFSTDRDLRREATLMRFSRSFLDALRTLDPKQVQSQLKPWLSKSQIKGLMARRDRILELADERIAAHGEDSVLYP